MRRTAVPPPVGPDQASEPYRPRLPGAVGSAREEEVAAPLEALPVAPTVAPTVAAASEAVWEAGGGEVAPGSAKKAKPIALARAGGGGGGGGWADSGKPM